MKKIIAVLVIGLSVFMFTGCESRNVKEELAGDWFVWHWYYNVKDGENGFFDEAQFYSFSEDGKLTINANNTTTTADYEFTTDDKVQVTYSDGTLETFQLIPAVHEGVDQIQFMCENTNYTITLEPMSEWENTTE